MSSKYWGRPLPTLYKTQNDLEQALYVVIDLFKEKKDTLATDEGGYVSVEWLCVYLKSKCPNLSYINSSHIVELFFKDPERCILVNGVDKIKYRYIRYVQPPEVLYFGTTKALAAKMRVNGIQSGTKGYVKLHDSPARAVSYASKFMSNPAVEAAVFKVDTARAFSDGWKFSIFNEGEYNIVRIDKKYLIGEVEQ